MTRFVLAVAAASMLVFAAQATAADVFEGSRSRIGSVKPRLSGYYDVYDAAEKNRAGYVKRGASGRWDMYERTLSGSYVRLGYVKGGSGDRWEIYEGCYGCFYEIAGYVRRGFDGRWNIYEQGDTSKVGYVKSGPGAPAAGAAYVLLIG